MVNDENPCGATGKRKLETVHYEDSIMAMKCRKFEKGDSYSTKESESTWDSIKLWPKNWYHHVDSCK